MEWFNGLGTSMIYKRCFYLISEKIFIFDVLRIRFIPYSILTIRIYNRDNPYSYMNPIAIRVRIRIRAEIWKQIWYQRYPFVSDPFSSLVLPERPISFVAVEIWRTAFEAGDAWRPSGDRTLRASVRSVWPERPVRACFAQWRGTPALFDGGSIYSPMAGSRDILLHIFIDIATLWA